MTTHVSAQAIDELLPQTQCTRCGYAGCRPYAEAIANGEADINQCPPGGTETILALAALTGRAVAPLNHDNGIEAAPTVAFIDEERCIGCTRCLPPCPVDAIVGAPRLMHTVVAGALHGLRVVHRALPGRLHPHGAVAGEPRARGAGAASRGRQPRALRGTQRTQRAPRGGARRDPGRQETRGACRMNAAI